MSLEDDILKLLPDEDITKLRDLYKKHLPYAVHVVNFFTNTIKWKTMRPEKNYVTLLVHKDGWNDGTFVALLQWSSYDLFLFTLENDGKKLYSALINTKYIDWNRKIFVYALHHHHYDTFLKVAKGLNLNIVSESVSNIWWISQENAQKFEISCPPEVYIKKLDKTEVPIINQLWPHRNENSDEYLAIYIEMNGGYGIYLKSNNEIVAWILKNHLNALGVLQTLDEYKRRGYGTLLTKLLSHELSEENIDPLGTIVLNNRSSQNMFKKIGFEKCDLVIYINVEPRISN